MDDEVDRSDVTLEELEAARYYALLIEWSPEDDAFVVSVPDLPGVHTHGTTREEGTAMGTDDSGMGQPLFSDTLIHPSWATIASRTASSGVSPWAVQPGMWGTRA